MAKTVKGNYTTDDNFVTVYGNDNRLYTIARTTGEWGSVGVGEMTGMARLLTQDYFDAGRAACTESGTFVLEDD